MPRVNAWMLALALWAGPQGAAVAAPAQEAAPAAASASASAPAEIEAVLSAEKQRLERFMSGEGYNYLALEMKLREVLAKVDALMARGDFAAAQEALAPLAALRPLDDIPHIGLIMRRVRLLQEAGQMAEATTQTLRYMLLEHIVAGGRDALSEAAAIEVPFIEFEYVWMARRGLKRQSQQLHHRADRSLDVLQVLGPDGQALTLYFDVTRLVKLRTAGIQQLKS